jgi:hypothetical protein
MKIYQYDDIQKTNQALASFKRNGVNVLKTDVLSSRGVIQFFIFTDPELKDKPKTKKPRKDSDGKKEEKTKDQKEQTQTEEKKEDPKKPLEKEASETKA